MGGNHMQMMQVLSYFKIDGAIVYAEDYGNGHINKTYLVTTSTKQKYILQQINTAVFKKPKEVMKNIARVTNYIRQKSLAEEGDVSRVALEIVPTNLDKNYIKFGETYWRCYKFINGARTYEKIEDKKQFYEVGKAIGKFQKQLNDFPIDELFVTIPDFHNTPKRFQTFLEVAKHDKHNRGMSCFNEFKFVIDREQHLGLIMKALEQKHIPYRVTHNDTKLNNVMLDEETNQAICVIDLDTVMPGSVLFDFGDAIRIGASTALEDERDLSKVQLDLELFHQFSLGFLEETKLHLNEYELRYLVDSTYIITLECGMRFLTDYLDGDQYFKTHYDVHNLVRARNQFKLVREIEEKREHMQHIIDEILKKL